MYVDADTIIELSTLLAAIAAIAALGYRLYQWVQKQEQQSKDIDELNSELYVISYAILACLDGLNQLGANGNVTKAHEDLEEHLNQRAHGQTIKKQ